MRKRLGIIVAVVGCAIFVTSATAARHSSISVTKVVSNQPLRIDGAGASQIATRVLGVAMHDQPAMVRYGDEAALGLPPHGVGWLFRGTVHMESRGDIGVNVIVDGETGNMVAAYTDSTGEWPVPATLEYDLAENIAQAGWQMGDASPDRMTSNLATVLETACHHDGMDPTDPGQLIVRPRWNSPRFPAKRVGDNLVPVRGKAKVWTIQQYGRKREGSVPPGYSGADLYFTEQIIQLEDGTLEFWGGFSLP